MKVLTHRPRRIETADVPELIEHAGVSPATEPDHDVPVKDITNLVEEPKLERKTE